MRFSKTKHNGEIINSQQIAGFRLTETVYAPNISVSKHLHQHACFCLVLQGLYTETYREKAIECQPSHLIFRPAEEIHSDYFGRHSTRCLIIEFETEWLESFRRNSIKFNEPASFRSDSLLWLATRLRKETRQTDDFSSLTVEGLMLEMVAEVGRRTVKSFETEQPRWLKQAREILHETFAERMPLSRIAESVGVHPVYLAELFRRHYQCTVGEYTRRLRIEFASRQISETDTPLADIALTAGFSHQAHFSRTFKRFTGLTPAQFRAISRRKP